MKQTMLLDPLSIADIIRVAREVPFFGLGPQQVDAVQTKQQQAMTESLVGCALTEERHRDQPPSQVLGDIGRMFGPAVGTVGDDAAMGQIGKACPEDHRRPDIDHHQSQDHPTPKAICNRRIPQPLTPGDASVVGEILATKQRPERLIADQRRRPAKHGGLGRTDMGIGQPKRHQVAHRHPPDVDEVEKVIKKVEPRLKRSHVANVGGEEFVQAITHGDKHQWQKEPLDQPPEQMLA